MAAEIKIPRAPAVKTRLSGFVHGTKHEDRGVGLQCAVKVRAVAALDTMIGPEHLRSMVS